MGHYNIDMMDDDCDIEGFPIEEQKVTLPCLFCGTLHKFDQDSNEAKGIFNVFCSNKDCEDRYALKL